MLSCSSLQATCLRAPCDRTGRLPAASFISHTIMQFRRHQAPPHLRSGAPRKYAIQCPVRLMLQSHQAWSAAHASAVFTTTDSAFLFKSMQHTADSPREKMLCARTAHGADTPPHRIMLKAPIPLCPIRRRSHDVLCIPMLHRSNTYIHHSNPSQIFVSPSRSTAAIILHEPRMGSLRSAP